MSITLMTVPQRTAEQRDAALKKANDIRMRRARMKGEIKRGGTTCQAVLKAWPEWVGTMKVADLLGAKAQFGRVRVARVLNRCRISGSKSIAGLTPFQRGNLIAELDIMEGKDPE